MVERRPADDGVLPQHDRPAHRDDRQPDADRAFRSCRRSSCRTRASIPDRAAADLALPPVDRLLGHRQLRRPRRRLAQPGHVPLQHLPDGEELDRARQPRTAGRPRRAGSWPRRRRSRPRAAAGGRGAGAGGRCAGRRRGAGRTGGGRGGAPSAARDGRATFKTLLRDPSLRDPRGFILPADQPDFPTATKFVNTLLKIGVTVHRATAPFAVAGKSYPAGSYVVKIGAGVPAARDRHVRAAGSSERHPVSGRHRRRRPYDNAGWTLAYQMGVQFDRILDGFDGPVREGERPAEAGARQGEPTRPAAPGYLLSHAPNDAFIGRQPPAGRGARTSRG